MAIVNTMLRVLLGMLYFLFVLCSFASGNWWLIMTVLIIAPLCCAMVGNSNKLYIQLFPYRVNGRIPSARRQIAKLFDMAQYEICIVSGSLKAEIYEEEPVKEAIQQALMRGVIFKIVVVDAELDERLMANQHWTKSAGVNIKYIPGEFKHMIMVDALHTRIEKDHDKRDGRRTAILRYHGPELADEACGYFDRIFERKEAA